jgi:flagellar hook-associated protein 2
VQAEAAAPSAAINRREAKANAQISALATVKSAFAKMQTAVNALKSDSLFSARTFSSDQSDYVTAKAGSGSAALGSFEVVVDRLAQANKIRFNETPNGTSFGPDAEDRIEVSVDSSNNTLRQLAASINAQAGGQGVSASVIGSASGETLVLTALNSGADSALSVTPAASGSNLDAFDTGTPTNFTEIDAAQDARAFIDGVEVSSSSNTLSDVLDGVSLTLIKLTDGSGSNPSNARITVAENVSGAKSALSNFVKAYNDAFTAFDLKAKTAAALNGDALVRGAGDQLRRALGQVINDVATAGLGSVLSSDATGKLSFDASAFDSAYSADPAAVQGLFSGASGSVATRFAATLDSLLGDGGSFAQRSESLQARLTEAGAARERLDARLEQVEARYRRQFVALDALIGQLGQTSSFLNQQLSSLPGVAPPS